MRRLRLWGWLLAAVLLSNSVGAAELTRAQALAAIEQPDAVVRLAGARRLAAIGLMADVDPLLALLGEGDRRIRETAESAIWDIWSRSGDPVIDALYARGIEQMQASALDAALATFDDIVRRKPDFAEGWNKRATINFLLGRNEQSLQDCNEVFKRNPVHFGALAGAGQIHLQSGRLKQALEFFRRAVRVNPNLDGPAQMIPLIEQRLQDEGGVSI